MRIRPLAPRTALALARSAALLALVPLTAVALGCGGRADATQPAVSEPADAPAKAEGQGDRADRAEGSKTVAERTSAAAEGRPPEGRPAPSAPVAAAIAPPPTAKKGPRSEEFSDLETLCAALHHDYIDGTLTDYYRGLTMKTGFGDDLRNRGEESMTPGRILEAGRRSLGDQDGDPATPACAKLFDELDDLE